jgi:Fic family protein
VTRRRRSLVLQLALKLRTRAVVTINRQRPGANGRVLRRIHREFLEMPGMQLTLAQAQRLWDLDSRTCEDALAHLIERHFLARDIDGQYVRSPKAFDFACAGSPA